jgi:hypothetical protein
VEATWYRWLLVFPVADYVLRPFNGKEWRAGWVRRAIERIREVEYSVN